MQSMNAKMQYQLSAGDMQTVLAIARGSTLAEAGSRLGLDGSTVFRNLQKLEKGLGQQLFERSRRGYQPTDLGLQIAQHAERIEAELEAARSALQTESGEASGTVRITTTDTVLHKLVLPALKGLAENNAQLRFEMTVSNELASLTRRDADIAVRATQKPPEHLVGKHLGPIRVALFTSRERTLEASDPATLAKYPWIAPDDALPDHLSVRWRRKHLPKVVPQFTVNSILSVMEAISTGLGIGLIPLFLAQQRDDLIQIGDPIAECETQLWLLAHPESRHLHRVATVFRHLGERIILK
jgi:DNA-binding transcriptional LysR family regulator